MVGVGFGGADVVMVGLLTWWGCGWLGEENCECWCGCCFGGGVEGVGKDGSFEGSGLEVGSCEGCVVVVAVEDRGPKGAGVGVVPGLGL